MSPHHLADAAKARTLASALCTETTVTSFLDIGRVFTKHASRLLGHEKTFQSEIDFADNAEEIVSLAIEAKIIDTMPSAENRKEFTASLVLLAALAMSPMVVRGTARGKDSVSYATSTVTGMQRGTSPSTSGSATQFRISFLQRCEFFFCMPLALVTKHMKAVHGKPAVKEYFTILEGKSSKGSGITVEEYEIWKPFRWLFTSAECTKANYF